MKRLTMSLTQAELETLVSDHIAKSIASDRKVSILGMTTTPPPVSPLPEGHVAEPELGVLFVTFDIV